MEIVQETCLRLLQNQDYEFNQDIPAIVLLKRISLHLAIDHYRRGQTIDKYIEYYDDYPESSFHTASSELTAPELEVAKQQYEQLLLKTIQTLPPICQDVFILTQLYHLSHMEVAEQFGISRAMVTKHLSRAVHSLVPILFEQ